MVATPRDREAVEHAVVRGSDLLKQGKIEDAQRSFRAALELEPDNPRVLALLGLSHFRANQLADARPIYEQLVDRAPTDASHRLNLGLVYLKLNDADKAIDALEASRALDPSQGRAVSYLGLAYARAGRYAEAYRAFLLAGQHDLAIEIEANLTAAEVGRIQAQLGRSPQPDGTPAAGRTPTPGPAPRPSSPALPPLAPAARSSSPSLPPAHGDAPPTPIGAPRTKPPSAPPRRTPQEHPVVEPPPELARDINPAAAIDAVGAAGARESVRYTESMQFVAPRIDPAAGAGPGELPVLPDGNSMISRAVASAGPLAIPVIRTRFGGVPPRPLSDLATHDLVRPDESDDAFEIGGSGALIIRVSERVMTRLDGVHVTGGDLAYELAMRRSRGHNTDEAFDHGGSQLHAVTGRGYLIAIPGKSTFSAVRLDDDILYLREDLVFAFQPSLRWENGNVPGLRGKLPVVQFRGDGALVLRLARGLVRIKLPSQGVVFIDSERLAGWIGRVIPRAVVPPPGGPLGTMCIECTGEGVVLVEPAPDEPVVAATSRAARGAGPGSPREPSDDSPGGRSAAARPSRTSAERPAVAEPAAAASATADSADDLAASLDKLDKIDSLDEL